MTYSQNDNYYAIKIQEQDGSLKTIIYFASDKDLITAKLESESDGQWLASNFYKLSIYDKDSYECASIYCSQEFIAYLFVNKPSVIDGCHITRPSLPEATLLFEAIDTLTVYEFSKLTNKESRYAN